MTGENIVYDCPCEENCKRHGHCIECIRFHRKLGWPLVACMQQMLKEHKKQAASDTSR
jgi:hypothetical protein